MSDACMCPSNRSSSRCRCCCLCAPLAVHEEIGLPVLPPACVLLLTCCGAPANLCCRTVLQSSSQTTVMPLSKHPGHNCVWLVKNPDKKLWRVVKLLPPERTAMCMPQVRHAAKAQQQQDWQGQQRQHYFWQLPPASRAVSLHCMACVE